MISFENNHAVGRQNDSALNSVNRASSANSATLRWNQHPVIATVLWILGSEETKSPLIAHNSSLDHIHGLQSHQAGSTLSDASIVNMPSSSVREIPIDQGDEVDEDTSKERSTSSDGTQLYPSINSRQRHYHQQAPYSTSPATYPAYGANSGHHHYPSNGYGGSVEDPNDYIDTNQSPQWGFYVPITPPQQEMFSAIKKDLLTIQQSGQQYPKEQQREQKSTATRAR